MFARERRARKVGNAFWAMLEVVLEDEKEVMGGVWGFMWEVRKGSTSRSRSSLEVNYITWL
jgi:hypothetical protein